MIKSLAKKLTKKSAEKKEAKAAKKAKKTTTRTKKTTSKKASSEELFALIEKKAYEFFESRGYQHGDDQNDWFEAEKQVFSEVKK
ncbi:DUF2934 domain-containing protein [Candidatus Omnitrophota bacterium]